MNRRAFLTRTLAFLPVPAFARVASLWLPKERPFFVPEKVVEYKVNWAAIAASDEVFKSNIPMMRVRVLVRDIVDGKWKSPAEVWGVEIPYP